MQAELQVALVSAGVLALGIVLTYLIKMMKAKIANAFLGNMLARVAEAIAVAVKATAQTYGDALKERAADGQLTKDEQRQALQLALVRAKSYLSLEELAKAFGLVSPQAAETFLADKIESAVRDLKATAQGK